MIFRQLFDRESSTYTYLVACERTRAAALVDPVLEQVERDLAQIADLSLTLTWVLDTHVHADHVTGAGELRRRTGAKTAVSEDGGAPCADCALRHGDVIQIGDVELRVRATPGHTRSCVSFVVVGSGRIDRVLTGDALLIRGCGRTDFQEGDSHVLFRSVLEQLFTLGDDVLVYPAHDYKGLSVSTIGEERRLNPRLGGAATEETFVAIMAALHLPPPAKLAVAVPANRACGDKPE